MAYNFSMTKPNKKKNSLWSFHPWKPYGQSILPVGITFKESDIYFKDIYIYTHIYLNAFPHGSVNWEQGSFFISSLETKLGGKKMSAVWKNAIGNSEGP